MLVGEWPQIHICKSGLRPLNHDEFLSIVQELLKVMPSATEKQRRFMGADLARKRKGQKTKTGMSERQLREFASTVNKEMSKAGFKKKKK